MKSTNPQISDDEAKTAKPLHHLVHATSKGRPLCGDSSIDALIGSYVEHLDTTSPGNVKWVREVFGAVGEPVEPCPFCISLYPPALIDIVPFNLNIVLNFKPSSVSVGYDVSSEAFAEINGIRSQIKVFPGLLYFSAKWIGSLNFSVDVDANPVVPFVEHANKTKQ